MRISSEEYKGLCDRIYEIIENEFSHAQYDIDVGGTAVEAANRIKLEVIDQLVKIKEITY